MTQNTHAYHTHIDKINKYISIDITNKRIKEQLPQKGRKQLHIGQGNNIQNIQRIPKI